MAADTLVPRDVPGAEVFHSGGGRAVGIPANPTGNNHKDQDK
jgi:hypothetical protein